MLSDFEQIKRTTEGGQEYWTSRELGNALGYSTYQKFTRILNKACVHPYQLSVLRISNSCILSVLKMEKNRHLSVLD